MSEEVDLLLVDIGWPLIMIFPKKGITNYKSGNLAAQACQGTIWNNMKDREIKMPFGTI